MKRFKVYFKYSNPYDEFSSPEQGTIVTADNKTQAVENFLTGFSLLDQSRITVIDVYEN
jgi:hypothetical protein